MCKKITKKFQKFYKKLSTKKFPEKNYYEKKTIKK